MLSSSPRHPVPLPLLALLVLAGCAPPPPKTPARPDPPTGRAAGSDTTAPGAVRPIALVHVNVLPVDGERVLADHTVLCQGDRIVALGPSSRLAVPAGARIIDGRGRFLMPGLSDMHVHLRWAEELPLFVALGVT